MPTWKTWQKNHRNGRRGVRTGDTWEYDTYESARSGTALEEMGSDESTFFPVQETRLRPFRGENPQWEAHVRQMNPPTTVSRSLAVAVLLVIVVGLVLIAVTAL